MPSQLAQYLQAACLGASVWMGIIETNSTERYISYLLLNEIYIQ